MPVIKAVTDEEAGLPTVADVPATSSKNIDNDQGEQPARNTPMQTSVVKFVELTRIALVIAGLAITNYRLGAALIVFGLAGLTALESLLIGSWSARSKQWPENTPYQRQSACNNLASTITMIILLAINASDAAVASVMLVVVLFILLSGINHLFTELGDHREGREVALIHYFRFVLALALSISALVVIFANWKPFEH